jgi:hypothetical protein
MIGGIVFVGGAYWYTISETAPKKAIESSTVSTMRKEA